MLAGDPAEALDKAEEFLKERPLSAYYDEVALKGLKLAQTDIDRKVLDVASLEKINSAVTELVEEFEDHEDQQPKAPVDVTQDAEAAAAVDAAHGIAPDLPTLAENDLAPGWRGEAPVLCIAGRTGLDEAAATMLAQLLLKHGLRARVEGATSLATANISRWDSAGVSLACVSAFDVKNTAHLRFVIRRLRRRLPEAKIVLACWMAETETAALLETVKSDAVTTTLRGTVKICLDEAGAVVPAVLGQSVPPMRPKTNAPRSAACDVRHLFSVVALIGKSPGQFGPGSPFPLTRSARRTRGAGYGTICLLLLFFRGSWQRNCSLNVAHGGCRSAKLLMSAECQKSHPAELLSAFLRHRFPG